MEIGLLFAVDFESPDLKMGIIFAVLKHSGKIPSDSELLNSIETVGANRGARSVDLLFCLRIRLTISSLSEGWQKN